MLTQEEKQAILEAPDLMINYWNPRFWNDRSRPQFYIDYQVGNKR